MNDALQAIERAVQMVADPANGEQIRTAVLSISPALVDDVVFGGSSAQMGAAADGMLLGVGLAASPGVGVGVVVESTDAALDVFETGADVVLVCDETGPADEPAMRIASAIVTRRGGRASHAAIVARQWGVPAVCGIGDVAVDAGQLLLVDGSTGEVRLLSADFSDVVVGAPSGVLTELPPVLATLLGWADQCAEGRIQVLANADLVDDATRARAFGAKGIGLCRTEHQFLGERAGLMSRIISGEHDAVGDMVAIQRSDFVALLEAMSGLPVTVRLLDAPLHEFVDDHGEHNPMLGLRGVRLALTHPQVLEAQVEALCGAMADISANGASVDVRVMVPMVTLASEMGAARDRIRGVVDRIAAELGVALAVSVGTMIETPRAALCAGSLASLSDFFSFGTNDLTQLTWGFSRDDLDAHLVPLYQSMGLLDRSPFETLDTVGVVRLMALAAETGRSVKPSLGLSMCGEQGADPASVAIAVQLGLDSVSVSPYRVPAARLAAAHAVLAVTGLG